MPGKLRTFKLPDDTIAQLDAIARSMPIGPTGLPATRTDALIMAVDRLHERVFPSEDVPTPDTRTI